LAAVTDPGTEDQRKYSTANIAVLDSFIVHSGHLDGLSTYYESQLTYFDIYLDTPDYLLFKNQYSFRFRKRNLGAGVSTYAFQLKSEMDTGSSVRMEIDESELEIYKVKTDIGWLPLTKVLDYFFTQLENKRPDPNSQETKQGIIYLENWIQFKANGCVTPFQKLLHLKIPGIDSNSIKTLRPTIYGFDKRKRSHVFIDTANTTKTLKAFKMNQIPPSEELSFFKSHPSYNWVLETSLDSAVFYPLFTTTVSESYVSEFEVENKYYLHDKGSLIMDQFEKSLETTFHLEKQMDSKYCRSIKKFQGK
jgi:hypothetical protein